ncbi:hypothetical protein GCM10009757_43480 [Streptomyces cheonanensis]|uniref:Uncharacterized protein n=1 Tax=Streptomyces cheonanensis TaxID=312720 RepID=A0ABP5H1K2_9ACTN
MKATRDPASRAVTAVTAPAAGSRRLRWRPGGAEDTALVLPRIGVGAWERLGSAPIRIVEAYRRPVKKPDAGRAVAGYAPGAAAGAGNGGSSARRWRRAPSGTG